ncbi:hypothetical protein BVX98_00045, partial [bacterium F11]
MSFFKNLTWQTLIKSFLLLTSLVVIGGFLLIAALIMTPGTFFKPLIHLLSEKSNLNLTVENVRGNLLRGL